MPARRSVPRTEPGSAAQARRVVRHIEDRLGTGMLGLDELATVAGLSPADFPGASGDPWLRTAPLRGERRIDARKLVPEATRLQLREEVYAEDLQDIFTELSGLHTRL